MEMNTHLDDVTFTVIDLETTGSDKQQDGIIEVAAYKVLNGRIIDEFTSLVNPNVIIPYFISQYTNITNEMVADAPSMHRIAPKLAAFLAGSVFVAHNVQFDFGFVNASLVRHGLTAVDAQTLCTVRLARRLAPKNVKKNLGDLAAYFGIGISHRHRAGGDAYATVLVLNELIKIAKAEYNVVGLDELLALQYKPMKVFRPEARHVKKIREQVLPSLPEKPGVYVMKDKLGNIIYIGKSVSLKSRVASYFTALDSKTGKVLELVGAVRTISYFVTGSELEALLMESKLIKQHRPRYNTLLKRYRNYPFLKLTTAEDFPKLEMAFELDADGSEYFGPFDSRSLVESVLEIVNKNFLLRECTDEKFAEGKHCLYYDIKRCCGPCVSMDKAHYAAEVAAVLKFISGEDAQAVQAMESKMQMAAARGDFEEAARVRDEMFSLRKVVFRQSELAASVNENNCIILLPSVTWGETLFLFIRFGRLVFQASLHEDSLFQLREKIQTLYFSGVELTDDVRQVRKEEVDEMRIITSWIFHNRTSASLLYLDAAKTADNVLESLIDKLAELKTTPLIEQPASPDTA
jgi:DNA polymerase-3 subunit epsilon